ncbi:MAG TPA: hypothetical protein VFX12_00355 [Vicinamibacterales bacterium]|nr:hypothetical protein [Vicinamibacterales bacterium]
MQVTRTIVGGAVAVMLAAAAGCTRDSGRAAAAAESKEITPPHATSELMTVTGCLRAGDAAGTYVLVATQAVGTQQTATYQLDTTDNATLRGEVNQQVKVNGTMTSEQQLASRSAPEAVGKPKATTGTPTVETKTDVRIRHLRVNTIQPTGDRCQE